MVLLEELRERVPVGDQLRADQGPGLGDLFGR